MPNKTETGSSPLETRRHGPFRHGQHVIFNGEPGFVVAGFNEPSNRVIVAKVSPKRGETNPQHVLAAIEDLRDDSEWIRRD